MTAEVKDSNSASTNRIGVERSSHGTSAVDDEWNAKRVMFDAKLAWLTRHGTVDV